MKPSTKEIVGRQLDALMRASPALGTQEKLAKRTGIGQTTIGRIRRGEVNATADNLRAIAEAFHVSVGYLYGEEESRTRRAADAEDFTALRKSGAEQANTVSVPTRGKLPLISWVQAGAWGDIVNNFAPGDAEEWIPCPFNHGPGAFILRVVGHSMYNPGGDKSYAPGEYIAVDPSAEPLNKRMVVARLDHEEKATFKQLVVDHEGTMMLQALNPGYVPRIMTMPPGSVIAGVVIGKWVPE